VKTKVGYYGIFLTLALILSYVESLLPIQIGIPGVKLGLANLVCVVALYKMRGKEVVILAIIRVLLAGFIFGNYFSIIYGLAGAILSVFVMIGLKKTEKFSVPGVSIAGGVSHNMGQLIVAVFVVQTYSVGYYFPVLLVAGLVTGLLIGICANEILKRITHINMKN
jgi:heptaprenyl diphosphate synthase